MDSHPNARLTQKGRHRLVIQHLEHGCSLKELAAENGTSLRRADRWLARYRSGGSASLADRWSVRRSQRRTLDPQRLQHAVDLRHQRLHLNHIARCCKRRSPPSPGLSAAWGWGDYGTWNPNHRCSVMSGSGQET